MASLELSWASLLDDIDRTGRELPFIFVAVGPATEGERCLFADDDELQPGEDVPVVARRRGFTAGLLVDHVQQAIETFVSRTPLRDVTCS